MTTTKRVGDTDVLVVGAGPTGLMAAICLRQQGVERVRIVDARDAPSKWAKATALQTRSLQILGQLGGDVLGELYKTGMRAKTMEISDYDGGKPILAVDLTESYLGDMLLVEQWRTEEVLANHLAGLGVEVERGEKVETFNDTGSFVQVELESGERFNARYVVGCDGAHSSTRHHLGVTFEGEKVPGTYALIHCMIDDMPFGPNVIRIDVGSRGWVFITPMGDGSWIVVFDLTDQDRSECSPDKPSLGDLKRLLAERGVHVDKIHSPIWRTYFNVHSRQAERYSVGRIFLCGDAAHIHSPLGGQGMNMGIQDAHNLAWKLALVVRGEAAGSLLESYHEERHAVDHDILRTVERVHSNLSARHPVTAVVRNKAMSAITSLPLVVHEVVVPTIGQTRYTYGQSDLCRESWGNIPIRHILLRRSQNLLRVLGRRVKAGDRAPDCELEIIPTRCGETGCEANGPLKREKVRFYEWAAGAGTGYKALIFEGLATHKLQDDQQDLASFGTELLKASGGLISGAAVVPLDPTVYKQYGVHGQCLMLVRPDGFVGLRQEPLSAEGVLAYLEDSTKAAKVQVHCAPCTIVSTDPAPRFVLSALLLNLSYVAYSSFFGAVTASTYGLGWLLALFGTWTFAEVKRDWYLISPDQRARISE